MRWIKGAAAIVLATAIGVTTALAQNEAATTFRQSLGSLSEPITQHQFDLLHGPYGPRPGIYRLRALHSGGCLSNFNNSTFDSQDHVAQAGCYTDRDLADARLRGQFAILPHPAGDFTIRTLSPVTENGRGAVPGQISNCATVARGVVFGPARIDFRGCDLPSGAGDWLSAGIDDQRFAFYRVGQDVYQIFVAPEVRVEPRCWAVQGGTRDLADVIRATCDQAGNQRFTFEWIGPVPAELEQPLLQKFGWFRVLGQSVRISPARAVELSGSGYSTFETAADDGDYCMRRCAELTECRAWTWSAAGYRGAATPMCKWHSTIGTASNRGYEAVTKVTSGITRP